MSLKFEFRSANHARRIGLTEDNIVLGLQFVDAQLGIGLAVVPGILVGKVGGKIVNFKTSVGMLLFLGVASKEAGFGPFEIEIVHPKRARLNLLHARP